MYILLFFLTIKALLMIGVIQFAGIGLSPDEAQYWTWSQYLDWGYYSKPPGIAWQIKAGTSLFSDTELGVRIGSVVFGFFIPLAVYFTAKASGLKQKTCLFAGLIMALTPVGVLSSLFAITDVGMVLFWTLALSILSSALALRTAPRYLLLGVVVLAGALFKWPMYLIWFFVLGLLYYYPFTRKWTAFSGFVISLLGLLPSIYWNASHNWVTFRHVFTTVKGGSGNSTGNFFEFLGAQAGLFSPLFFVLLAVCLIHFVKNIKTFTPPLYLLYAATFLPLLAGLILAIFQKMQGNWCDFAYPAASIVLAYFLAEKISWGPLWLKIGLVLSAAICAILIAAPSLKLKINPFKHNMGWDRLSGALIEFGYQSDSNFLFGDKYQTASLLSFYGPKQHRAYFLNLQGTRQNQFSFWPGMKEERLDQTGFFVAIENAPAVNKESQIVSEYLKKLAPYFGKVEFAGSKALYEANGASMKSAYIFKCFKYNGQVLKEPGLY